MKKIRLGNTIDIVWEIFLGKDKDKGKYDLTGKKLTIYLVSAFDRIKISDFTTEFNVLRFTFEGKDQKHAGRYQMTFVENEGGDDTRTLDKCDAFELVRGSCMETDDLSEITLASSFDALRIYPIIPQVGPNRNWWVDGVDTGKSSVGLTAYEFAKELGYEGTEEEYAAECLAVPVLNEESRTATEEALAATEETREVAEGAKAQLQSVSGFMSNVAVPTITRAELAAEYAEQATQEADAATAAATAAAAAAESAISNIAPILNEKQDKLVSGENIKTLNGQSLLGEGDVEIRMTHVTDFTVEDLSNLYHGSSDPKQCDLLRLQNSLANKEIILVPYGPEEVNGYSLLHGYSDDLLYFSVTDERGNIYSVETDKNAREIYSENITFISPVTNQTNIANLQQKDTQTDAKLTELSEELGKIAENTESINGDIDDSVYIVDPEGNAAVRVNERGVSVTALSVCRNDGSESAKIDTDGISADTYKVVDDMAALNVCDERGNLVCRIDENGLSAASASYNLIEDQMPSLTICDADGNILIRLKSNNLVGAFDEALVAVKNRAALSWIDDDFSVLLDDNSVRPIYQTIHDWCIANDVRFDFAYTPSDNEARLQKAYEWEAEAFRFLLHPQHEGWYAEYGNTHNIALVKKHLVECIRNFKKNGFVTDAKILIWPGSSNNFEDNVKVVSAYCECAIVATYDGANYADVEDRYQLKRIAIVPSAKRTKTYIKEKIRKYIEHGDWVILYTHLYDVANTDVVDETSASWGNVKGIVEYANSLCPLRATEDVWNERKVMYQFKSR